MARKDQSFPHEWFDLVTGALRQCGDMGVEWLTLDPESRLQLMGMLARSSSGSATGRPEHGAGPVGFAWEGPAPDRRGQPGVVPPPAVRPPALKTPGAPAKASCPQEKPPGWTPLSTVNKLAMMAALRDDIGDCRRCKLSAGRAHVVFGEGDVDASLMFVGEGPGADEDETGRPFVGRAGQLLDLMVKAMTLRREDVYIANVVKCRPPQNRVPLPEEASTCGVFVMRQIEIVQPRLVVCLGATAAQFILRSRASIGSLRGAVGRCGPAVVVCTYHPAYLLRNPAVKKDAWEDLKKAMALLGLQPPQKAG